jgi:hypothetical protein
VRDGRGALRALVSYVTGQSPNTAGVCSPPSAVRWDEAADGVRAPAGGVLIDRYRPGEPRGYPTLCKGRFEVGGLARLRARGAHQPQHAGAAAAAHESGIDAIKIEGRQRSPSYVAEVTKVWRSAIDAAWSAHCGQGRYSVQPAWDGQLARWAEGQQHTLGAYDRPVAMSEDMNMTGIELSVGPLLYWWPRNALLDFYAQLADAPVQGIVLGELVLLAPQRDQVRGLAGHCARAARAPARTCAWPPWRW